MAKTKMKKGYITLEDGRTMRVQKMSTLQYMIQHKWLYFLLLPGALYFILFRYVPMGGLVIAFKEYSPFQGMWGSPWCGFDQFTKFFTGNDFSKLLMNTLGISLLQLVLYFPAPIILSLFLNEVRHSGYKRVVQTLVYIPHFVSWVIVASLTYQLFNVSDGIINIIIKNITGSTWDVLSKSSTFWGLIVGQDIWRETGYGTIVMMFILRVGGILNTGYEQIFLMRNDLNVARAEVFDTYIYMRGIRQGQYSFSAAAGMFKSVVGMILVVISDRVAKACGESGIY